MSAPSASAVTSAVVFAAVASAVDGIELADLTNFQLLAFTAAAASTVPSSPNPPPSSSSSASPPLLRALSSGEATVSFDVVQSLATVSNEEDVSDAQALELSVASNVASAVSSGALSAQLSSQCGCSLDATSSAGLLVGGPYPTLAPTTIPTGNTPVDDDGGTSEKSKKKKKSQGGGGGFMRNGMAASVSVAMLAALGAGLFILVVGGVCLRARCSGKGEGDDVDPTSPEVRLSRVFSETTSPLAVGFHGAWGGSNSDNKNDLAGGMGSSSMEMTSARKGNQNPLAPSSKVLDSSTML